MNTILMIDGSAGEGGGQILRTSLALSMALGTPFHLLNIRAGRPKPGLRPQHLACVKAAQEICGAAVQGAELDSREIIFEPGTVKGGNYRFDIGTGGSCMLLLQAILPPLLTADAPSTITVTGGTHVPLAPPFEFLRDCLFPRLEEMGPKLTASIEKIGYMFEGGGSITVTVAPVPQLQPFHLTHGTFSTAEAVIYAHGEDARNFNREQKMLLSEKFADLGLTEETVRRVDALPAEGSGNAVIITTTHGNFRMVFGEYGQKNRLPPKVAEIAARHALEYVRSDCAVDYHLGDQLLVPLSLAGGGSFTVTRLTSHIATCLSVIRYFMDCTDDTQPLGTKNAKVAFTATVRPKGAPVPTGTVETYKEREVSAPWRQWGEDLIESGAREQMRNACSLPNAICGALMPDAHTGYGLPIGGVLAVKDAVIPFAVGVDIACRMRMTVLDLPVSMFENEKRNILRQALRKETRFGIGASFSAEERREHAVMDEDWNFADIVKQNKTKAWKQLGTSGKGNHFVEFGELYIAEDAVLGGKRLTAGTYLALLSHSGSRGTGESVAQYYSNLAMQMRPYLPEGIRHLAWLDLDSDVGQQYWEAMQLMGRYAQANHELIHQHILRNIGAEALTHVENHHNFAWVEEVTGQKAIVHRKGATPAALGVEGIIPGSMGSPAFVVHGKGNAEALNSCAHGAGRLMSRAAAFQTLNVDAVLAYLADKGVELMTGQLDEAPMVYKDIQAIMAAQQDLVDVVARFEPRLVKMAPVEGGKKRQKEQSISTWR
ncbi:MAG: RNA 3'-phosphate cyclase [Desulfovibrionaceae bacterium]|nr:RNA 3'-phosphate cyclase [Desulfovibrionaceae bacterium]